MTFGLFSEFEEGFLDFNIWQRVNAAQLTDAHFGKAVLAGDVGKSVDNPGSLVISSVCKRRRTTSVLLTLLRKQLQVGLVDETEYVLPPGHQILLPCCNVVPNIR
ncbi:hypothetical protein J3459_002366 [Metarhizium acridum]|nr:hypothetical protein J3459_002366 [Metarhizium acridum]